MNHYTRQVALTSESMQVSFSIQAFSPLASLFCAAFIAAFNFKGAASMNCAQSILRESTASQIKIRKEYIIIELRKPDSENVLSHQIKLNFYGLYTRHIPALLLSDQKDAIKHVFRAFSGNLTAVFTPNNIA